MGLGFGLPRQDKYTCQNFNFRTRVLIFHRIRIGMQIYAVSQPPAILLFPKRPSRSAHGPLNRTNKIFIWVFYYYFTAAPD